MIDLVVLVSGSGTNLQSILDAIESKRLDARILRVVSNLAGVRALERAEKAGVPTQVLSHKDFINRQTFDVALAETVGNPDYVVLAGFMRILTATFLDRFPYRVINIHPSLLPAFPGVDAQKQALDKGVRITGCTVHLVDAGTDTGAILAQAAVPVRDDDTRDTLAARILDQEHKILPAVLQWIAEGRLQLVDGRPRFSEVTAALSF